MRVAGAAVAAAHRALEMAALHRVNEGDRWLDRRRQAFTNPDTGKSVVVSSGGTTTGTAIIDEEAGTITFETTFTGLPEEIQTPGGRVLLRDAGIITFIDTLGLETGRVPRNRHPWTPPRGRRGLRTVLRGGRARLDMTGRQRWGRGLRQTKLMRKLARPLDDPLLALGPAASGPASGRLATVSPASSARNSFLDPDGCLVPVAALVTIESARRPLDSPPS
jgi:hypothetical protein